MRYDPCGRIVAMVRRPYRTTCRFFNDSDEENTIHWYVVPKTNPTLPYKFLIYPNDQNDLRMNPKAFGEVPLEPRPFDGWNRIVPPVPTDHICGDPADFAAGCSITDPRPPLVRGPDGIPTCCRPIQQGLVVGGTAPAANPSGGGVLGGAVEYFGTTIFCPSAPDWFPLTTSSVAVVNCGSGVSATYLRVRGLAVGSTYRFTFHVTATTNEIHLFGGLSCFAGIQYNDAIGPGSLSYTFDKTIPAGANEQWVLVADGSPIVGTFVVTCDLL